MGSTPGRSRPYGGKSGTERQEDRRGRLLNAGTVCFGQDGYEGTTVDAVCAEAHVGKRYFYELFDSLEGFFIAVYEHLSRDVLDTVATTLAEHSADLEPGVNAAVGVVYRRFDQDPHAARILLSEILGRSPRVDAAYRTVMEQWTALIGFALGNRRYRGVPTDILAGVAFGLITGTALRWQLAGRQEPIEELINAVNLVLGDVLAGTAPSPPAHDERPTPEER